MTGSKAGRTRRPRPQTAIVAAPPVWRRGMTYVWAAVAFFAVGILFYAFTNAGKSAVVAGSGYESLDPSAGDVAPPLKLASTAGPVDLADFKGERVLLYFQEGIGCQPCWDQMRDFEQQPDKLKAAGIDRVISVTTSPLDLVQQKVKDDGIATTVAADPDLAVSQAYRTSSVGMMGTNANGHSFILVGEDGTIDWRADYGAAPRYTMYVPVDKMLADLAKDTKSA